MATFNRLLGFLRPYRRAMILSWLFAGMAMVMTVAVPYLTGQAVDALTSGASHREHHQVALSEQDRTAWPSSRRSSSAPWSCAGRSP